MTEGREKLPTNALTAEELLQNKGLKYNAWDEYERSVKTLPKTGMKQFEPDGSWLQNMQIEKSIKARKNLIAVERVDRSSQLASAEWLPAQKRARVKKYSGQDWGNFGLEKSCALYLIPEEALFLLEANCLELTWNDVPLSIQQAYELLIDNVECSIEEYRVYSQLVRCGYRIQRFVYDTEKNTKSDESPSARRKVIVEPENGLWMADSQQQTNASTDKSDEMDAGSREVADTEANDSRVEICQDATERLNIPDDVHNVIEGLLCAVENTETRHADAERKDTAENCSKLGTNSQAAENDESKRKRNSKLEIISEETLLGNIKIVTEPLNNCDMGNNNSATSWRSARIQRNVKLLPKRTDKLSLPSDISIIESNTKTPEQCSEKHKVSSPPNEEPQCKKAKHEVIELSDDEIQEVPQPMTRMELLNLIPNIAHLLMITVKISRGYVPHSIKPQKTVYHYDVIKLKQLRQSDRRQRYGESSEYTNNNVNQNMSRPSNTYASNNVRSNPHVATYNQNLTTNVYNRNIFTRDYFSMERRQYTNFDPNYACNNRFPFAYSQNSYWHQRGAMFQNVYVALENHSTAIHQNRFLSVQMNNFQVPNLNNPIRNFYTRNQIYHNVRQGPLLPRRFYHQRVIENTSVHCSVGRNVPHPEPRQRYWPRNHHKNSYASNYNESYQSSFKVLPGMSSWSELKTKWREEKTITIDDEEKDEIEDCNEVQVVGQLRSPLIGPKSASLEDVFSKLRIIKSAPEKTVRRKKSRYKISYNVYSSTQNYRKANPGPPLYRMVVIRQDGPFLQPIELHRLLQDANNSPIVLACVSMTISYIQPGLVSIPNLT
ncbi:tRNA splicing endonuclease subunit 54 [Andrena cerasifolii]|uniref:tRNA splicing endonuclease subunit 54 n=1 Tax=Andrena cerasifolii TaxID=2819439 RepID=UPI004037E577